MSRKVGQIIARGEPRWLVRVYLGRDRETRKRIYHNRTIYGSLRHAQAYVTRRLHERDLSRGVEGFQITVDGSIRTCRSACCRHNRGKSRPTLIPPQKLADFALIPPEEGHETPS